MKKLLSLTEIQTMQLNLMNLVHDFCVKNNLNYYLIGGGMLGSIRHSGFIPWDDDLDIGLIRKDYNKLLTILKEDSFGPNYRVSNSFLDKKCGFYICRIYFKNTFIDNKTIRKNLPHEMYFDIFPLDFLPNNDRYNEKIKKMIYKYKLKMYFATTNFSNPLKKLIAFPFFLCRAYFCKKINRKLLKLNDNEDHSFVCSLFSQYSFDVQKMPSNYYGNPTLYKFENYNFYGPEKPLDYLSKLFGDDYLIVPPISKRRHHFDTYLEDENE